MSDAHRQPPHLLALLVLIALLAAFLRIHAGLQTIVQEPLQRDAGDYFSYAYNLRHNGIYSSEPRFAKQATPATASTVTSPRPDAVRSPGYPIALIPFVADRPTDRTVLHIVLAQALLGILMVPMCFLLARSMLPGYWALLPSLLVALSPQLVIAGTYVLSETLFAFLLLLFALVLNHQLGNPRRWPLALLAGIVLGLASLTRPTFQYFLPVLLAGFLPLLPAGTRLRQGLAMTGGFMIAFAPWIIRNLVTLGYPSDPTLAINTMVHGHYPDFMYQGRPETLGFPYRFDPHVQELSQSVSAIVGEIIRNFVAAPLVHIEWFLIGKPLALFSWDGPHTQANIFTYTVLWTPYNHNALFEVSMTAMSFTHGLWMLAAVLTTLYACLQPSFRLGCGTSGAGIRVLALLIAYFVAVHIAGFPLPRYTVPMLPILFVMAAVGIRLAWSGFARGDDRRLTRGHQPIQISSAEQIKNNAR